MDKEQISRLAAGRELDDLIERFVFERIPCEGWHFVGAGIPTRGDGWMSHPDTCRHKEGVCYPIGYPQEYSTEIELAWRIVEEFRRGWRHKKAAAVIKMIVYDTLGMPDCECKIYAPDIADASAIAEEMPLAICRAALEVALR